MNNRTIIITVIAISFGVLGAVALLFAGAGMQSNLDKMSNYPQIILPLAYGLAGSLEELQNEFNSGMDQVKADIEYRSELLNYTILHQFYEPGQYYLNTTALQDVVKEHMISCKLGSVDIIGTC